MAQVESALWSNLQDIARQDVASEALKPDRAEEKKREFLRYFIEELKHQDPLSPLDHKDISGQLAQFSSLEENVRATGALEDIRRSMRQQEGFNAAAWVGKDVRVDASTITYDGQGPAAICYDLPPGTCQVDVHLVDAMGNLVRDFRGEAQGENPTAAGPHKLTWDGLDARGERAVSGAYRLAVRAVGEDGQEVPGARAQLIGRLDGVELEGGKIRLKVAGERFPSQSILEVLGSSSPT